ncbi:MAG: metal-sensitive transcriptional regulator [Bacillota bacterium]
MSSYAGSKDDLLRRLNKIEGQVKGVQRMVNEDKYCVEVLIQIAAIRAAISKVGMIIFEHHTRGCLRNALDTDRKDEMVEELIDVLQKFMKYTDGTTY